MNNGIIASFQGKTVAQERKGKIFHFEAQGKMLQSFLHFFFFLAETVCQIWPELTKRLDLPKPAFFSELMIVMKNFSQLRQNPELFQRDKLKMVQKSSQTSLYG